MGQEALSPRLFEEVFTDLFASGAQDLSLAWRFMGSCKLGYKYPKSGYK